ncbi:MAG: hypothetical protein IPN29_19180 [Saprospiraceae bacterium]|nr:hypothetical protein [Saprospiraceae bacterium]
MAGLNKFVMVCLMFVGASMFSSLSAQYVGKSEAIARLEQASNTLSQNIANLPPQLLDYRYGQFRLFMYRAIHAELVEGNSTVAESVNNTFLLLGEHADSMMEYHALMAEFNKVHPHTNMDFYYTMKTEIKELLKG